MAEEIPVETGEQATFTEMFEVRVKPDTFTEGLQQLQAAYEKWRSDLGSEASDVIGAGFASNFKAASESANAFSTDLTRTLNNLATTINRFATNMEASLGTAFDNVARRAETSLAVEVPTPKVAPVEPTPEAHDDAKRRIQQSTRGRIAFDSPDITDREVIARHNEDTLQQTLRDLVEDITRLDTAQTLLAKNRERDITPSMKTSREMSMVEEGQLHAEYEKAVKAYQKASSEPRLSPAATVQTNSERRSLVEKLNADMAALDSTLNAMGPVQLKEFAPGTKLDIDFAHPQQQLDEVSAVKRPYPAPPSAPTAQIHAPIEEKDIPDLNARTELYTQRKQLAKEIDVLSKAIAKDEESAASALAKQLGILEKIAAQNEKIQLLTLNGKPDQKLNVLNQSLAAAKDRQAQLQSIAASIPTGDAATAQDRQARTATLREIEALNSRVLSITNGITAANAENNKLLKQREAELKRLAEAEQSYAKQDAKYNTSSASGKSLEEQLSIARQEAELARQRFDAAKAERELRNAPGSDASALERAASTERAAEAYQLYMQAEQNAVRAQKDLDRETEQAIKLQDSFANRLRSTERWKEKLGAKGPDGFAQQMAHWQQQVDDLTRKRHALESSGTIPTSSTAPSAAGLNTLNQYDSILRRLTEAQSKLADATKKHRVESQGLLGVVTQHLGRALRIAAEYTLAYRAINLLLEGLTKLVLLPVSAFRDGTKYLEDMEQRVDKIGGAINATTRFSSNLADQLRMSADAAQDVAVLLQRFSAKNALDPNQVANTYVSLKENGAGSLVKNEGEVVQLTEQLSLVTKIAKTDAQRQTMAEEIPRLMQGQVTGVNHILQGLGLTNDQWNNIVVHSRTHRDLLQQLSPYLAQYDAYLSTTQDHHAQLSASIKQTLGEIEAAFAAPIYKEFESFLKRVRDWLEQHHDQLVSIAGLFGNGLSTVIRIGEELSKLKSTLLDLKITTGDWGDIFKSVLSWVGTAVIDLDHMVESYTNLASKLHHDDSKDRQPGDLVPSPEDNAFNKRTAQEPFVQRTLDRMRHQYHQVPFVGPTTKDQQPLTWHDVMTRQAEIDAARTHRVAELNAVLSGKPLPGEKTDSQRTASVNKGTNTRNTPEGKPDQLQSATSEFRADEARYRYYVDQAKRTADAMRQTVEEAARLSKISYQEAATQIAAITAKELKSLDEESNELFTRAVAVRKQIESAPGLRPEQRKAALNSFDANVVNLARQYADSQAAITKIRKQADTQAAQELDTQAQNRAKSNIAMARDELRAKQELDRQLLAEGRILHSQELADDKAALDREHALQQTEFEQQRSGKDPRSTDYLKSLEDERRADEAYAAHRALLERQITETTRQEEVTRQRFHLQILAAQLASERQAHDFSAQVSVDPSFSADDQRLIDRSKQLIDLQIQEATAEYAVAAARNKDFQETRNLALLLEQLHQQRIAAMQEEIAQRTKDVQDPVFRRIITQQTIKSNVEKTQGDLNQAKGELDKLGPLPPQGIFLDANPDLKEKVVALTTRIAELTATLRTQKQVQQDATPHRTSIGHSIIDEVFGPGAVDAILGTPHYDANGNVISRDKPTADQRARGIAEAGSNAAASVNGEVNLYKQGAETGGTAGGIGALLAKGPLSDALSQIPLVGAFVKPVGELMEWLSSTMRSAARKIAQQINTEFENTTKELSNGTLGTAAGLRSVTAERDEAINRLTNMSATPGQIAIRAAFPIANFFGNGAMDELAKLLPPMTEKIQELVILQQQIFQEFNNQLQSMQLQSDTLGQINSQWLSVNEEVAKYIDAGGDAVKATQMLNLSLQQIQRSAGAELTQGYDQAVKDAINLNQLTQRRYQMELDFKKQQFDLVNADSIERMQAGAVTRGQELQKLRTQYQQNLDDMNAQISLESQKVAAEGKVFSIAQSISDLHRQDEALTVASLNLQLQKYKDLQNAVSAINAGQGAAGPGDPGLAANLKAIDQQVVNYANALKTDVARNKQGDSANNTKTLLGFLQMAQDTAKQLASTAGGSLVGTGDEGDFLGAIEAAQTALQQQGTFVSAHPGTDTGGWASNLSGYLDLLTSSIAQLSQTKDQLTTGAPSIGFNTATYSAPQLDLSGLQTTLNSGFGLNQNNSITINVNVPAGTSTAQIGTVVADSVTQELQRQFRQGIS